MVATLALCFVFPVCAANASIVDMERGRHSGRHTIAPGKFLEVCGKLRPGRYDWIFKASEDVDFNIHFHVGEKVVTPTAIDATPAASATLVVSAPETYCWMWTNRSSRSVSLEAQVAPHK